MIGLNAHIPSPALIAKIAASGIRAVRVDLLGSRREQCMNRIRMCHDAGLAVLVVPTNDIPIDTLGSVVMDLRGRVEAWSLGNEPNLRRFWMFGRERWLLRARILSDVIRACDPAAIIVGPELAHLSSGKWWRWLQEFIEWSKEPPFELDVIAHHVYPSDSRWSGVLSKLDGRWCWQRTLRKRLKRAGWTGPVWITETGVATDQASELEQFEFVRDAMSRKPHWIDRVYLYEARDDGDPKVPRWGLLHTDLTPKAAWSAVRA